MTQASILRSSTRVVDRMNTRVRRESDAYPEEASLVNMDREQVTRNSNLKPKINNQHGRVSVGNGVVSSHYDHNLVGVTNGGAITRV